MFCVFLSYSMRFAMFEVMMVGAVGFEPTTSCV